MNWVFTCLLANKCTVIDNSVSLALLCVRAIICLHSLIVAAIERAMFPRLRLLNWQTGNKCAESAEAAHMLTDMGSEQNGTK